ncbi:hypothetical protein OROHE_020039 [Orobanche hederae]
MNWGRLTGRAFLCTSLDATSRYVQSNRNTFRGFKSTICSFFRENPECNKHELEGKAKSEHDSNLIIQTADCAKKRKKVEKQTMEQAQEKLMEIRNGDMINLYNYLFTKKRDYLVKYNNQQFAHMSFPAEVLEAINLFGSILGKVEITQKVKAEQLEGKVIAVYFMPLPPDFLQERMSTTFLMDTYNYLLPRAGFEVVLVPYECDDFRKNQNPEKEFEDIISRTPWTAIPFTDKTSINRLRRRFGIDRKSDIPLTVVIDSTGMVLQTYGACLFNNYGGLGYPFSNEKIEFLKLQDKIVAKNPSLKTLLASPERDYVISNKGDKVPIRTLEEKVVALYFCVESDPWCTQELKLAYEVLIKNKENFEVVLIYVYDTEDTCNCTSEESFWKTFKTMPWLALPFRDPSYRALKRFFGYPCDRDDWLPKAPQLVIFGPHGEFIEPWGADILTKFKFPAYPFTRDKVVKLEIDKVKDLRLEMLWDENTVFRRTDGTKVPLSHLSGKRIICFFLYEQTVESVKLLKERYLKMRDTDGEFEVIYVLHGEEKSTTYSEHIADVPWLLSHTAELLPGSDKSYCCYAWLPGNVYKLCSVLAFDRDGRLVRKSLQPEFEDIDFPFNADGMEKEAFLQLNSFHDWDEWDRYHQGLIINSSFKNVRIRDPEFK